MTSTQEQPDQAAQPRRVRRCLCVGVLVLLLVVVAAFVRFASPRMALEPTPRPEYWEARIAEVDPPPSGALTRAEADDLIVNRPWETKPPLSEFPGFDLIDLFEGSWDARKPEFAAVEKVFASTEFRAARERMRQAVERGWYFPVVLPPASYLPHLSHCRAWGRWLVVHSRWEAEVNKDFHAAAQDWLTTLGVYRQTLRSRLLIDTLVCVAGSHLVGGEMVLQARQPVGSIDSFDLALRIENVFGLPLMPSALLAGERIYSLNEIESVYVREGGDWMDVRAMSLKYDSLQRGGTTVGLQPSRLWNLLSPVFHDVHTAAREVDAYYASLDACVDIAGYQEIAAGQSGKLVAPKPGILSGFPNVDWGGFQIQGVEKQDTHLRGLLFYYASYCQLEAGVTMLALREYHRRHGRYPDRLSQLVPGFLPRLPIDYADRQPLRYRPQGDGYVLYSIGLNGRDDGGQGSRNSNRIGVFNEDNPDVVFTDMRRRESSN